MKVLAASSLGGAGHLEPVVAVARTCAARGDDVTLLVPPALEGAARTSGLKVLVGAEPPAGEVAAIRDEMARGPAAAVAGLVDRELFARRCTVAMRPAAERAVVAVRPDVVLRESCEYATVLAGAAANVPVVTVAVSQGELERAVLDGVAPILDGFAAGTADAILAAPYLTAFPATLDPPAFAVTLRYRVPAAPAGPPPEGWERDGAPRVYVSFGSVAGHTSIAERAFGVALAALEHVEVRALLTVGRRFDVARLGPVPPNVQVERWRPQADVLALADAVLCHGGSGTVLGALAAGVPLLVCPLFADNARNGRAVAAAGAGVVLPPLDEQPDPPHLLRAGLAELLGTPSLRAGARRLAVELAESPTPDVALRAALSPPPGAPSSR